MSGAIGAISIITPTINLFSGTSASWQIAEWLINYESGFVRRGLFGEATNFVSHILQIDQINFVNYVLLSIYTIFVASSFFLFIESKINLVKFIIFSSPAFLLFNFYDVSGSYRKEILFLGLFSAYLLSSKYFSVRNINIINNLMLFLFVLAIFVHELIALCIGFIILTNWLLYKENKINKKQFKKLTFKYLIATFISLLFVLLFRGDAESSQVICKSIKSIHPNPEICTGAISWLGFETKYAFILVLESLLSPAITGTYLLSIFLSSLPFLLFVKFSSQVKIFFGMSVALFLPAFFLGLDYGRWIYWLFAMFALIVFRFDNGRDIRVLDIDITKRFLFLIYVAIYLITWSIPHCCSTSLGSGLMFWIGKLGGHLMLQN